MKFSNTEIENLAEILHDKKLGSIAYEQDGCKIVLTSEHAAVVSPTMSGAESMPNVDVVEDSFKTEVIKCPLIGHFYLTPTPDSAPFVTVGSKIECGEVIGILQAMKVSNEIKSEISGEIVEVFVQNGQFVDYDAPLFKVRV
ncbi:biotin/lipoyl-containing protein [Mollicutes bacterium LVI A0039]|nr:biotin/lipoyl-containing protein [Mollicutes bacterium LVI A0039]